MSFRIDGANPTKFNSLPRRKATPYGEESFARSAPARRSAPHGRCLEYFVPRSLSEFDLSAAAPELCVLPRLAGGAGGGLRGRDRMVTFEDEAGAEGAAPVPAPAPAPADVDVFM